MKYKSILLFVLPLIFASGPTTSSEANNIIKLTHQHKPSHHVDDVKGVILDQSISRDLIDIQNLNKPQITKSGKGLFDKVQNSDSPDASTNCISVASLASFSGNERINYLKTNTDFSCFENNLWDVADTHKQTLFNTSAMIARATEASVLAQQYDATNSNGLRNFIAYLRVGFWAKSDNRSTQLTNAMIQFFDSLTANENYYATNELHGFNVKEVMILMYIEPTWRSHNLATTIKWLKLYNPAWGSNMQNLLTKVLTLFYRGRNDQLFKNAVESDRALVVALNQFLLDNEQLIGHSREYQYNDAASEFARLLSFGGQTYQETRVLIKNFLTTHSIDGDRTTAWIKMASQIDAHDGENCDYYGTCNYLKTLEGIVLPINHQCSSSLIVRAQAMTSSQLNSICNDLTNQEIYFHQKLNTNNNPVADDNNSTLELVIYDSSSEYKKFSGVLFNHSTDNGGIYLEGNPSIPDNIPRFMAHEAEWVLPEFLVWNLTHEYVHYLDGRFNKYGTFSDGFSHDTVWWGEGLAEYISKKDDNPDALEEAIKGTYTLSQLFKTTYEHSSARIYPWGYLAVRYMFERHNNDVAHLLTLLRNGQYDDFDTALQNIGNSYNSDFSNWLTSLQNDPGDDAIIEIFNGDSTTVNSDGSVLPGYFVDIPENTSELIIQISGGTIGDADLHVKYGEEATRTNYDYRPWKNGSNETVTITNPSAGQWFIMISPYRDQQIADVQLSVSWSEPDIINFPNSCIEQTPVTRGKLANNQAVCIGASTTYISMWVSSNDKSLLKFSSEYGDGDATIYYRVGGWPSTSQYDIKSATSNSNKEVIKAVNPERAWHYLMIKGQGTGMTLLPELID